MTVRLTELLELMRRLRGPDGCAWDREQTAASLAPYAIEEAYEVADAATRGDLEHLQEELGDLLFQVVFHAQLGAEAGVFDFDAVAGVICDKLIRRHPHVFSGSASGSRPSAAMQSEIWEAIKAEERAAAGTAKSSALDGVPSALPALLRADKLSRRAARAGFDFDHPQTTADKVAEELREVRQAVAASAVGAEGPASHEVFEEVGDLLFAAANLARKLNVDAESALRAANLKFERRFRAMESLAEARGESFERLALAAQEALWQAVKRAE